VPRRTSSTRPGMGWRALALSLLIAGASALAPASASAAAPKPADPDTSFGTGGISTPQCLTAAGQYCNPNRRIARRADGKLIVAVQTSSSSGGDTTLLYRFKTDGTLDAALSGFHFINTGSSTESLDDMTLLPDGRIIALGRYKSGQLGGFQSVLMRFSDNGVMDDAWGTNGRLTIQPFGDSPFTATTVAVDLAGRFVLGGHSRNQPAVVRLTSSGLPDSSFGNGGLSIVDRGYHVGADFTSVDPRADGTVVVSGLLLDGVGYIPTQRMIVARLTANGSMDASFNGSGVIESPENIDLWDGSMTTYPDGRVLLARYACEASLCSFRFFRYESDGSADSSFDGDGYAYVSLPTDHFLSFGPDALLVDAAGRIYAGAAERVRSEAGGGPADDQVVIVRLGSNGAVDPSFGAAGVARYDSNVEFLLDGLLQDDGKPVFLYQSDASKISMLRLVGGDAPDSTPPAVSFVTPTSESTVSGTVPMSATVTDNKGVTHVEFYVGSNKVGDIDTGSPGNFNSTYTYNWNSTTTYDGRKTLTAIAYDAQGNQTFADIHVQLTNANPPDTTGPTGSLVINSGVASTTSRSVVMNPSATDGSGVLDMRFSNDNTVWSGWEPYSTYKEWTLQGGNGSKTVYAQYRDTLFNSSAGPISATITLSESIPPDPQSFGPQFSWNTDTGYVLLDEASTASANGTWTDFDGDNVRCSTVIGTISCSKNNSTGGSWSWSWTPDDGWQSDGFGSAYGFPINADDYHGHVSSTPSINVRVRNVLPSATIAAPDSVSDDVAQFTVALNNIYDPSAPDRASLEYRFDCGSGFGTWGTETSTRCNRPSTSTSLTVHGQVRDKDMKSGQDPRLASDYSKAVEIIVANPTVAISSPDEGVTVGGTASFSATAADNGAVAQVVFTAVQGGTTLALGTDSVAPYTASWDTTGRSGVWSIRAKAIDVSAHETTASRDFTVDSVGPMVSITSPGAGTVPAGPTTVSASATDATGISSVTLLVDGSPAMTDAAAPYSFDWDSTGLTGSHSLSARAIDLAGNLTTSSAVALNLVIDPDFDDDGVQNAVDPDYDTAGTDFSDVPRAGATAGSATVPGGRTYSVSDAPAPEGVIVQVGGTGSAVTMALTGKASTITLDTGTYTITDPETEFSVATASGGPATITFTVQGQPHTVTVANGGSVTINEISDLGVLKGVEIDVADDSAPSSVSVDSSPVAPGGESDFGDSCATKPFTDVPTGHAFCAEIEWMRDYGISTGFGDGTYKPTTNVTRQGMSAFMARLAGATLTTCAAPPFPDVPITNPFCREIKWMKDTGISTGFGDGTYKPTANVTRQAMSAFMARLAGATLPTCTVAPFSDVSTTSTFCPAIKWMKDMGISTGFGDGTYRPGANVTRQAMSAFMFRLYELF
jgi:uncharacterized delta-60 repeat protein